MSDESIRGFIKRLRLAGIRIAFLGGLYLTVVSVPAVGSDDISKYVVIPTASDCERTLFC